MKRRWRGRTVRHLAIWIAGGVAGLSAVLYARLIAVAQGEYLRVFGAHAYIVSAAGLPLFIGAVALVKYFAPDAKGSGIPQVLQAIAAGDEPAEGQPVWRSSLVSMRTATIKVLSSTLGILGGASIGREGPTVQIAASVFAWVGNRARRYAPRVDARSFLIAGGAAGVAAAFNTPLAGITFALEEIAQGTFVPFRQVVMLAVILAGVVAQALAGDYLYFGHPAVAGTGVIVLPEALGIGLLGGALGGAFARLLAFPEVSRLPKHWVLRAAVCGIACALIGLVTHGATAGSGYEVTRTSLAATSAQDASVAFPALKLLTTVLSYLSGMAGGIFSPSLSIGAGIGLSVAKIGHLANFTTCAMLGMVAFFAATVQAPLTAVIIVMEMTDEHLLILPFMIAAFLAQSIGRRIMPRPLYHVLAAAHEEG